MKSRTPLMMIELAILLVVFALAALLCMKAFLWADETTAETAVRDRAFLEAQTAAEVIKENRGDTARAAEQLGGRAADGCWMIGYDAHWQITEQTPVYVLEVRCRRQKDLPMGRAEVTVRMGERPVAALQVGWQEVEDHE